MSIERVRAVCRQAVELSASERVSFFQDACKEDEALRRDVDYLLSNLEGGDGRDAPGPNTQIEQLIEFVMHGMGDPTVRIETVDTVSEQILSRAYPRGMHPERIGPYTIRGVIGEGAQGRVFLGERASDNVCTQVAIKLVKSGVNSESIKGRYHREAQILNDLGDHPGIARLRDVGKTEDDRPYLVLDYVEGQRLDRYCNAAKLDIRDRLMLFLEICDTVHYANTQCVAHRDLKPGNIIVTPKGRPKVIDFGIAKVLRGGSMRLTMHFAPMTLQYASPEQVSGDPVGIASDVYSLGVILFELLTGRLPYHLPPEITADRSRFERALRDAICRGERERPSVVVLRGDDTTTTDTLPPTTDLDRTDTTDRRHCMALSRRLRELDRIVLKALRAEPQRRYASVAEFADSIRCYLDGDALPKDVRPAGLGYRMLRFTRRNRVAVVIGTLLVWTIAATMLAGMAHFRGEAAAASLEAAAASLDATETRRTLVTSAGDVTEFVNGLANIMRNLNAVPGAAPAREELARLAVDHLRAYFDTIGPTALEDGTGEELIGFARALRALGRTAWSVRGSHENNAELAKMVYEQAMRHSARAIEKDPNPEYRRLHANGLIEYGDGMRDSDPDEAVRLYDEAANVMSESEWRAGGWPFIRTWTAAALGKGATYARHARLDEALPLFKWALEERAALVDADPAMARSYAVSLSHVTQGLIEQGAYDAAAEPARENVALRAQWLEDALAGADTTVSPATRRRDLFAAQFLLGQALVRQTPPPLTEASTVVDGCLANARELLDPGDFRSQRDLAMAFLLKGTYLAAAGADAEAAFAESRQILDELAQTYGFDSVGGLIAEVDEAAEQARQSR